MEILSFTLSAIFFLILLHCLDLHRRRHLPPGPAGLPLIGNLLQVGSKPHAALAKLAQKHGPLMTIRLGTTTVIVASTPDAAREVLQRHDDVCSGRIIPDAVTAVNSHVAALVWIPPNEEWRTIRKALSTFLTHQHKLDTFRDLRQDVAAGMLGFLRECSERREAVDVGKLAFAAALNQVSNMCLSRDVSGYESDEVGGFKAAVKTVMKVTGKFNVADVFPLLKPLDPMGLRRQAAVAYGWLDKMTEELVRERLEAKGRKYGDVLDSLLDYCGDNPQEFTLKHVKVLLGDLFIGGTETSSNTIEWAMTELLLNPNMFSRVREEISEIIGEDGKIQETKILDLPYLQTIIKETMRLHLAVPLLVPHKTETNVNLNGYIIPKDTQILVNVWAITRDPKYWKDPTVFMPERFLGIEVDFKGQHFEFLPFGSGRRMCPGIPVAHRVVSLTIATLVYHFDWKLSYAKEEMDMDDIFGLTLQRATPLLATPISFK